jgi:HD-like signal output (HDOD) protein
MAVMAVMAVKRPGFAARDAWHTCFTQGNHFPGTTRRCDPRLASRPPQRVASRTMNGTLAILIGGGVVALVAIVTWINATRRKVAAPDPIAATTGSNRTLTGTRPSLGVSMHWDEALRRFVAYALDDAPRESLSATPPPEHAPVFKAVQRLLERIEARPEYFPRRPSLLPKLMATVNDAEASMADMSKIIAQDPALTGNLLRIANSPLYRVNNAPIESIERAVTLVGVQGIRSIIATALVQPLMAAGSGTFSRFPELAWEHTLYAGLMAEAHATQIENAEPFVSQLVGLLYGLSAIVVFRIVRDQFAAHPDLVAHPGSVARLLESWVAPTAARIAASWELPERLQYALESQSLAAEMKIENSLGRSLRFGRVAGSLIVLCRVSRMSEAEARAVIVAGDDRRSRIERLWDRFSATHLNPQQ